MNNPNTLGVDAIEGDPRFNFLNKFTAEIDEDSILTNNNLNASPYNETNISCFYADFEQLISLTETNDFLVATLNIQSLHAKYFELVEWIENLNKINHCPDIICLQEIWQIDDPSLFPLDGYHPLIFQTRSAARGGGVGIYINNLLTFKFLPNFSVFHERLFETVFAEVTIEGKKCTIGSVYRPGTLPPGKTFTQQFAEFNEVYTNLISELNDHSDAVYLYGDLNLDLLRLSENRFITEYVETFFLFGFLQLVLKPTRISNLSASLIDHVITNVVSNDYKTLILCNTISDHFPIIHSMFYKKPKNCAKTIVSRNFSDPNLLAFRTALQDFSWQHILEIGDTQEAFSCFSDTFQQIFDLYFPLTKKKLNYKFNKVSPWITLGLLKSRSTKIKLNQIYNRNPTLLNREKLVRFRNLYNKIIREAKKNYYHQKLSEHKSNAKKTWQTLFQAIRRNTNKGASCFSLLINNINVTDPIRIAEEFNTFFTNAAADIVSDLHPTLKSPTDHILQNQNLFSLTSVTVTPTEVIEMTRKLLDKKTPDNTGLSSSVLKKIIDLIVIPLHHVINLSFTQGVVPNQLKIARVVPVFKSGDRLIKDNYRPISLLPTFSKIFEKIVSERLMTFLTDNNILSQWQFGFRPRHSTLHPMVHFMNHISDAFNEKQSTIAIFCDLRKAFDTCNHEILLSKLTKYGLAGTELLWFKSYLNNRKQHVICDNVSSRLSDILLGVPQGSILGPLLFLIYINDLPNISNFLSLLFADDTTLLLSNSNIPALINMVNKEFKKVCEFFRSNRLVLHHGKTNFILFTKQKFKDQIKIFCDNNNENENYPEFIYEITQISVQSEIPAAKFLGIYFDPQLNFKYHVEMVRKRLSKALYSLRLAKHLFNHSSLILLYYSLFHSHLIYSLPIWSCTSMGTLNPLFKMQKNAIRIVNNSPYNAHTEPLFKSCEILPFPDLIDFSKIQFFHRFMSNHLPNSFVNTWDFNFNRNPDLNLQLRNRNNINIPFARLSATEMFPKTSYPTLWQKFPDQNIKNIRKPGEFDEKLKQYFLNDLNSIVYCNRLFCPTCSGTDNY